MDRRHLKKAFLVTVYISVVFSASYYYLQLMRGLSNEYVTATLWDMMQGDAPRPFQYRVLMAWVVRFLLGDGFDPGLAGKTLLHRPSDYYFTVFWLMLAFLMILTFAFRAYLRHFFQDGLTASLLSLTLFFVLPYSNLLAFHYHQPYDFPPLFERSLFFIYDIPAMFFFTLGLVLLLKQKWRWYYPLFIIATFNRETTCFLSVVSVFMSYGRRPMKEIAFHTGLQFVFWIAVRLYLYSLYGKNPGEPFYLKVSQNLDFLSHLYHVPNMLAAMGWIWIPPLLLFRHIPDTDMKRSVLAFLPFVAAMFVFGNVFEFRIYNEFIPVMLAATWLLLRELMGRRNGDSTEAPARNNPAP